MARLSRREVLVAGASLAAAGPSRASMHFDRRGSGRLAMPGLGHGAPVVPAVSTVLSPNVTAPSAPTRARTSASFIRTPSTFAAQSAQDLFILFKTEDSLSVDGIVLSDFTLDHCGPLLRGYGGGLSNVLIERVSSLNAAYSAGVGRGIFMAGGPVSNVTIRSALFRCEEPITSTGDVYPAIGLVGKTATDVGTGFLFEDIDFEGFEVDYPSNSFPNCDGFSIEEGFTDGVIRRVRVARCADAGVDLKGLRWRLEDMTFIDCARSLKLWVPGHHGAIHSQQPRTQHILHPRLDPGGDDLVFDFFRPVSSNPNTPLVKFQYNPGVVRFLAWDPSGIDLASQIMVSRESVTAGASKLILPDGTEFVI